MPKVYTNTPITAGQLLAALNCLTAEELKMPMQFVVEPIHPRLSLLVNTFNPDEPHITMAGSLRQDTDTVPVIRTADAK